ncbi:MAG TPA: hypothetical protein VMX18_04605 [Candidatus Bipolaricaulota bacterium]|nr:hypothetical protein [Candidatus Bipolaricaulota bacterium]
MKKLILISGPSGSGKTTIVNKLLKNQPDELARPMTYTTRPRRKSKEVAGEYNFISVKDFKKLIDKNALLEWDLVYGNYYGKALKEIEQIWQAGKTPLITIDPLSIDKNEFSQKSIIKIFLEVPNSEILKKRIEKRNMDPEKLKKRLEQLPAELAMAKHADFIVKNKENELKQAVKDCEKIIFENA